MSSLLLRTLAVVIQCMAVSRLSDYSLLSSVRLQIPQLHVADNAQAQLGPQWCIADEQTPGADLQKALDWACGKGGADCSKIQMNQSCYFPNTVKDHASYAFNSYWQKFKNKGGSCYFSGAAMITELDPSHNSCSFEYLP